jgi:hypothetical protein
MVVLGFAIFLFNRGASS